MYDKHYKRGSGRARSTSIAERIQVTRGASRLAMAADVAESHSKFRGRRRAVSPRLGTALSPYTMRTTTQRHQGSAARGAKKAGDAGLDSGTDDLLVSQAPCAPTSCKSGSFSEHLVAASPCRRYATAGMTRRAGHADARPDAKAQPSHRQTRVGGVPPLGSDGTSPPSQHSRGCRGHRRRHHRLASCAASVRRGAAAADSLTGGAARCSDPRLPAQRCCNSSWIHRSCTWRLRSGTRRRPRLDLLARGRERVSARRRTGWAFRRDWNRVHRCISQAIYWMRMGCGAKRGRAKKLGLPSEFLERRQLQHHFDIERSAAILSHGNAEADPVALATGFLRHALRAGARLHAPHEVTDLARRPA